MPLVTVPASIVPSLFLQDAGLLLAVTAVGPAILLKLTDFETVHPLASLAVMV